MSTATRVTFEGAEKLPPEVLRLAQRCKDKVETTKVLLGLDNLNKSFTLDTGEQVYVTSNQFVSAIHIVGAESFDTETFESTFTLSEGATVPIGDFVSGVVSSALIERVTETRVNPATTGRQRELELAPGEGPGPDALLLPHAPGIGDPLGEEGEEEETIELDSWKVRKVRQTEASTVRFTEDEARLKLAVMPHAVHQPLSMEEPYFSQHAYLKPSNFTGYMRAVVQLLLGMGFVGPRTYEVKWIEEAPEDAPRGFVDNKDENDKPVSSGFGLPVDWDKIGKEIAVSFDYKFELCHGLGWGDSGDEDIPTKICYIVQIGRGGVFIMPLPLDPVSLLPRGRERYLELFPELGEQDEWGVSMFDKVGGLPTGECIPRVSASRDKYVRAGEVVKLLSTEQMEPFYEGTFVCSSFGWVFWPEGGRADNTCIKWSGDPGWKQGWHYMLRFDINPFNKVLDAPFPQHANWLAQGTDSYLVKKAKRITEEQYEAILAIEGEDAQEVYEARLELLEEFEVQSPYSGTAFLTALRHGDLYHPGIFQPLDCTRFSGQPQIKFPESLGLMSFDFRCQMGAKPPSKCDAPMAVVATKGGGIAVINYYYEKSKINRKEWNTRESCQYTGSWEQGHGSDQDNVQGNFYTSHIELRKQLNTGGSFNIKTTGKLLGYNYALTFCMAYARHGKMTTNVWHLNTHKVTIQGSRQFKSAIAFPAGERNVYYTLEYDWVTGKNEAFSVSKPELSGKGPIIKHGVISSWGAHFLGHCEVVIPPSYNPAPDSSCRLKQYRDDTTGKSCFPDAPPPEWRYYEAADSYNGCSYKNGPGEYGPSFRGPEWSAWKWTESVTEISYRIRLFGETQLSGATVRKGTVAGFEMVGDERLPVDFYSTGLSVWWFKPSPDFCGSYANLALVQSCWGNPIVNYDDQVSGLKQLAFGTPTNLQSHPAATYVGYIR